MALSRRERREQKRKLWREKRLTAGEPASDAVFQKKEYKGLLGIYDRHYLKLLVFPAIILVISMILVGYQIATTGEFVNKGVSLSGGIVITVPVSSPVSIDSIEDILESSFPGSEIDVRSATELGVQKAVIITSDNIDAGEQILKVLEQKIPGATKNASSETTGSALGESFFKETTKAMAFAFIFMAIVVFLSFRTFTPSMMVIVSIFADIVETIAAVNLLGLKISAAGIAAFLMLIGYSVDTDILLTSRVLRAKEGTVFERILSAAKTGMMLTITALIAVVTSLVLTQNETIREIMIILTIGLLFDIVNTWITNTGLLRHYVEHIKPRKLAAAASREERVEREIEKQEEENANEFDSGPDGQRDNKPEGDGGPR